jgi:hypothetical protein
MRLFTDEKDGRERERGREAERVSMAEPAVNRKMSGGSRTYQVMRTTNLVDNAR